MADVEPPAPSFWRAIGLVFEACARNARTCLALIAVYAVLNGIANAIGSALSVEIDPTTASASELLASLAAGVAGFGTFLLVELFVHPPTIAALSLVGSAAETGDVLDTAGVVRRTLDRALEAIGAFVLTVLVPVAAVIVVAFAALGVGVAITAEAGFGVALFGILVVAVPLIYLVVRLSLAVPVVIHEGLGPIAALRRSWDLVGGVWWWVFGVVIIVAIAGSLLAGIIATAVSLGEAGLFRISREGETNLILAGVAGAVGTAVSGTLIAVALGVVYAARAQRRPPAELPLPEAAGPAAAATAEEPSVEQPPAVVEPPPRPVDPSVSPDAGRTSPPPEA